MFNAYKELFILPGSKGLVLAGLLARLALPMTGIGIITMIARLRDDYALAGTVSALFVLTYALASPQCSRLVDRHGQSRILPVATIIAIAGMILLAGATWWPLPDWCIFAGAMLTGLMPSMSAMTRARWTALLRGQPRLQTAYSLEAVLDEVSFIAAPPLSVGLGVAWFAQAGILMAALLLACGLVFLLAQKASEPALSVQASMPQHSLLRQINMQLLILVMAAMGMIVGTIDIVSVAFASQLGQPAAASLVLTAYAFGSCLAGLIFGALKLRRPLHQLLLLGGLLTALTTLPLLLVATIPALALAMLVSGLFFAPTMIIAMALVERLVPEQRLTEGMTWLLAGLNIGIALGAALSGRLVEQFGPRAGFGIALAAAMLLVLFCLWGYRRLRRLG